MADNELNIRLKVNDDGSVVMDKFAQSIKNVEKNAQAMSQTLNVIKYDSIVNLGEKAFRAGQQFFQMAEAGAKIKSIAESFDLVTKASGLMGDVLLANLKRVTNDTIESSDLMLKANRMTLEGFSASQIEQIGEAARVAARVMGTDVASAYDHVADAVVNLRERSLKTAGFVIDFTSAYEKHAAQLGVTKDQLNEYGKQVAITEALHEKYLDYLKKMGPLQESQYERIQQQVSLWGQLWQVIDKAAAALWDYGTAGKRELELGEALQAHYGVGKGTAAKMVGGANAYDLYGGTPLGPSVQPKSQINVDLFAQKYGMSEAVLKDRLSDSKLIYEQWLKNWEIEGNLYKIEMERAQVLADDLFPAEDKVRAAVEAGNRFYREQWTLLSQTQVLVKDFGWEDYAAGLEGANDGTRELNRLTLANTSAADEMQKKMKVSDDIIQSLGSSIASSWSTNFTSMLKGSQTFSESVKNIFTGIGDAVINQISKMAASWLIFGSLTGEKNGTSFFGTSGGYGGIIGGIGSILSLFGDGGIVNRPTPAIIGDTGPEAVIPLKNGKIPIEGGRGGDQISIYQYIQIPDPSTFVKSYGTIVKKLSEQSVAEAKRFGKF